MRLSDLQPCQGCRGPIVGARGSQMFYVIRVQAAVVNPLVAGRVLDFEASTHSLTVAESMVDQADEAVQLLGDVDPHAMTEVRLCGACFGRSSIEPLVHRATAARRSA